MFRSVGSPVLISHSQIIRGIRIRFCWPLSGLFNDVATPVSLDSTGLAQVSRGAETQLPCKTCQSARLHRHRRKVINQQAYNRQYAPWNFGSLENKYYGTNGAWTGMDYKLIQVNT